VTPAVPREASGADAAAGERRPSPLSRLLLPILKQQGEHAPGEAKSYLVNKKTKGYAFLTWPAEYRASGVMTFTIDRDRGVSEGSGPQTTDAAKTITVDPDETWQRVDEINQISITYY